MGGSERLPLAQARRLADMLVDQVRPSCEQVEIAGSVRRQTPTCGDLELVVIPRFTEVPGVADLFGNCQPAPPTNELDVLCERLLANGTFAYRLNKEGKRAWGTNLKWGTYWPKTIETELPGFAIDLYSATAATYAVTLVIRTGPALFSKKLVTRRSQGGFCPDYLTFKGDDDSGAWRVRRRDSGEALETPTEESVFEALRLPYIPPELRSDTWVPRAPVGWS